MPLINAIKAGMKVPGYIEGDGPPREWPRPPLVTDRMLGCVKLQDYTKGLARTDLDEGEMAELVEAYLQTFVLYPDEYKESSSRSAAHWIRKRLHLPVEVEKWLFPVKVGKAFRNDVWRNFVHLMWWITSVTGTELVFNEHDLYCEIGNEKMGIKGGKTLSIYPELCVEVETPDWRPFLLEPPPAPYGSRCRNKSLNRILRETLYTENGETLRHALLILYARVKDKQNLVRLLHPRLPKPVTPLQKLKVELEACLGSSNPRQALRQKLVPKWMSGVAFGRLFKDQKPDKATLAEWQTLLNVYLELDDVRKPKRTKE